MSIITKLRRLWKAKRSPKITCCIQKGCKRKLHSRGLCRPHYQQLCYRVAKGLDTWERAEKERRCLPRYQQIRRRK